MVFTARLHVVSSSFSLFGPFASNTRTDRSTDAVKRSRKKLVAGEEKSSASRNATPATDGPSPSTSSTEETMPR